MQRDIEAAEKLLARGPDAYRLWQAWVLHADCMIGMDRLGPAHEIASRLEGVGIDRNEQRLLGWSRFMLGLHAWRNGRTERAIALLDQAATHTEACGDLTYLAMIRGRQAFILAVTGRQDLAIMAAEEGVAIASGRQLRHPSLTIYGSGLVAAALYVRGGGDSARARALIRRCERNRSFASASLWTKPCFDAGRGAVKMLKTGNASGIEQALTVAATLRLPGEGRDIQALLNALQSSAGRSGAVG
jgi:hypothetical protein